MAGWRWVAHRLAGQLDGPAAAWPSAARWSVGPGWPGDRLALVGPAMAGWPWLVQWLMQTESFLMPGRKVI